MALKAGARGLFGAASAGALGELKREVARLSADLAAIRAGAETQRQSDRDALQQDLAALAERFEQHVNAMQDRIAGDDSNVEALRLKLVGVADQLKWESEDLRKALAAIAQRVERKG